MNSETLEKLIEAILFYKGEPMKEVELVKSVGASSNEVSFALDQLHSTLENRGIRLVREAGMVGLATSTDAKEHIEKMRREELEGPLGKAGLETLAIVIYQGPVSRAEIDYVRGVNSSSILRSLSMRGLVEKIDNPKDKRSYLYRGTPELAASLGISRLTDAPNFEKIKADIAKLLEEKEREDQEQVATTHSTEDTSETYDE